MFGTSFDTSADKFQNYYKDLSLRLKNREIDLVIVVNMFLTGFDATTLNTLWVDKNLRQPRPDPGVLAHQPHPELGQDLRQHRLLPRPGAGDQRRPRAVRQQGRQGIVLLKPYGDYYAEYAEKVAELLDAVPARRADRRRGGAEGVHRAVRRDPAAAEHPDLVRRVRRQRDPHGAADARTTAASTSTCTPSSASDKRRREGVDQRRRRLRDRAHQAGRDQRRLHPDARPEVARGAGRRRRQGDPRRDRSAPSTPARPCATRRTSSWPSSTRVSVDRRHRRGVARFVDAKRREPSSTRSSPRRTLNRTRPARSSSGHSATARFSRPGWRSRTCYHRSRSSHRQVRMLPRSRLSLRNSATSLSGFSV